MKKIISLFLVLIMLTCSLVGCGQNMDEPAIPKETSSVSANSGKLMTNAEIKEVLTSTVDINAKDGVYQYIPKEVDFDSLTHVLRCLELKRNDLESRSLADYYFNAEKLSDSKNSDKEKLDTFIKICGETIDYNAFLEYYKKYLPVKWSEVIEKTYSTDPTVGSVYFTDAFNKYVDKSIVENIDKNVMPKVYKMFNDYFTDKFVNKKLNENLMTANYYKNINIADYETSLKDFNITKVEVKQVKVNLTSYMTAPFIFSVKLGLEGTANGNQFNIDVNEDNCWFTVMVEPRVNGDDFDYKIAYVTNTQIK